MVVNSRRNQHLKFYLVYTFLLLFLPGVILTSPVFAQEDFEIPQNCDLVLYPEYETKDPVVFEIRNGAVAFSYKKNIPAVDTETYKTSPTVYFEEGSGHLSGDVVDISINASMRDENYYKELGDCRIQRQVVWNNEEVCSFSKNGNFSCSGNGTAKSVYTIISGNCESFMKAKRGERPYLDPHSDSFEYSYSGTYQIVSPGEGAAIAAESTPPEGTFADGTMPLSADPDSAEYQPETEDSEQIPEPLIPLAAGAAAALAFLGTMGITVSNGTNPVELAKEIIESLNGKKEQNDNEQRSNQDIVADPRLHDKVTDVNGKQWIYYRRPGDEGGDGWTSLEEYKQTLAQENEGKIWSDRWGWVTKEQRNSYEKTDQKTRENYKEDTDDLLKDLVASEKRSQELDKNIRTREAEELINENFEKLEDRMSKIIKEKTAEGYYVRNSNLLKKAWNNSVGRVFNEWVGDYKGGQCGEYGKWGMEWSKDAIHEIYGKNAIITDISASNNRFLGHRASKVILPDGRRIVLDYWEGMPEGKPKIYSEEDWIDKWDKKLWGEYLGKAQVDRHPDEQNLKQLITDWGEKEGIKKFRAYQSRKNGSEYADIFIRSWERKPW